MTYTLLNIPFLLCALIIFSWRCFIIGRKNFRSTLLALGITFCFTAVFDSAMIAAGLVSYDPTKISGIFIGLAPIEDFAYSFAALLIAPSIWDLLAPREHNEPK